jgi:polar amino acid transport system substrate-binding protein
MKSAFMKSLGVLVLVAGVANGAAAGPLMDKIRDSGQITVGTDANYPPFEFIENGKIVGYGKEILTVVVAALSKEMGKDIKLNQLDLPFQGILPGLLAKQFDLAATSVGINPERAAKYAYTRPIAASKQTAIIRAGDEGKIKTLEDLNGKIIGTQIASASEPVVRAFDEEQKKAGKSGLSELKLFTSYPETYVALANGQIDSVVQSGPALSVLLKQRPGIFKMLGPISEKPSYLAWVVRPEDGDLREFVNKVLADLKASGKMAELQQTWFGFQMETPDANYLPEGAK